MTLAGAGVPLARIPALLEAPQDEFNDAIADLGRDLDQRIRKLQLDRTRLKQLVAGRIPAVPPPVHAYLEQLRRTGVGSRTIAYEQQTWILLLALYPQDVQEWAELKTRMLDDPAIVQLYRRMDEAIDWGPDDPRLHRIALDTIAIAHGEHATQDNVTVDRRLARLLEAYTRNAPPSWARLQQLLSTPLPPDQHHYEGSERWSMTSGKRADDLPLR